MSRDLDIDLKAETLKNRIAPIFLVAIDTAGGWFRMWTGYGTLNWNGYNWLGAGLLGSISPIEETSNVEAKGIVFGLSGVPSEVVAIALSEIKQNKRAEVYFAALDTDNLNFVGEPYLTFVGYTDIPIIDDDAKDISISLSAENRLIDLGRSRTRRFTPEDQKKDYPNDKGFDFVAGLVDKEITWGQV
jgi:hypothetical protein